MIPTDVSVEFKFPSGHRVNLNKSLEDENIKVIVLGSTKKTLSEILLLNDPEHFLDAMERVAQLVSE